MIRCLVVDDSPSFRALMREILGTAHGMEVIGEAESADEAVRLTVAHRPNVVTMDVQMPGRSGLEAVAEIMKLCPTPVIVVCSGASDESLGIGFKALQVGALEVLEKPQRTTTAKFLAQSEAIRLAVRAAASLKLPFRMPAPSAPPTANEHQGIRPRGVRCVGLIASTGGPPALQKIISALPRDFPAAVLIVQHLAPGFASAFAAWLDASSELDVRLAQAAEPIEPGSVLVAPDGAHLMASMGRVRLDGGPAVRGFRPSGTVLLASLARELGAAAAGVVLTGMGDDGAAGLRVLRQRGGLTLAQGPNTSFIYGMPKAAVDQGGTDQIVELESIAEVLCAAAKRPQLKTVLVVDDTETILEIQKRILEPHYKVVVARDGEEAVTTAQQVHPAAIVMDYSMPRMNGAQAMRALRADPATAHIPVVVVTSETAPRILAECKQAGSRAILGKPVNPGQLVALVFGITSP
ncbi:MAG: chemotaxis-specific protein-glutamate methyltransferase CheB [Myxococcaceae bacterium]